MPKTEVQELFDKLGTADKGRVMGYMQSLIDTERDRDPNGG